MNKRKESAGANTTRATELQLANTLASTKPAVYHLEPWGVIASHQNTLRTRMNIQPPFQQAAPYPTTDWLHALINVLLITEPHYPRIVSSTNSTRRLTKHSQSTTSRFNSALPFFPWIGLITTGGTAAGQQQPTTPAPQGNERMGPTITQQPAFSMPIT